MNISEFAKIAGVSRSAVSRYFNNGYLSCDKKKLIEDAIEKTGYLPSTVARNTSNRITKLVGVIVPKLSDEGYACVIEGISEVLDKEGYKLLLINAANEYKREVESPELFQKNRVDGVILLGTFFNESHKSVLEKMSVPVIIVGQQLKGLSCICHDDEGAARALTELMIEKGAKRPAMITVTQSDLSLGKARLDGFKTALADAGMDFSEKMTEISDFTIDSGYMAAKRMFSHFIKPDSILCATDTIAAGAALYCREAQIDIPSDVMLCGIGGSKIGRIAYPSLTTARLHYRTAGTESANMLLSAIKHEDSVRRIMKLGYNIVERESTGGTSVLGDKCENV